jgi:hypothetical protein
MLSGDHHDAGLDGNVCAVAETHGAMRAALNRIPRYQPAVRPGSGVSSAAERFIDQ